MTINDKLAKYVLDSLVESEEYSKNTKLPSGKPSASGRSKPKSATPIIKSSDEQEVDEEDLDENNSEYLKKLAEYERKKRNRDALARISAGIGSPPGTEAGNFREPRKPKPPRAPKARRKRKPNREDSSTNWKDRIVYILLEKRGDASARALAGARKAHADLAARTGRETTHNAFEDRPVPKRGSPQAQELADRVKRAKTVIKHGPYSDEMSNTNKKINAHREKHPINYPTTTSDRHKGESGYRGPRRRKTTQSGMYFKTRDGKDVEI